MLANKAKASVSVAKPNTLAVALNFGGLAERSNAIDCKSTSGAHDIGQGFESLTRRHLAPPANALTSARGMKRTAEAARIRKFSIRLLAVNRKEIHNDVPQLPDRM